MPNSHNKIHPAFPSSVLRMTPAVPIYEIPGFRAGQVLVGAIQRCSEPIIQPVNAWQPFNRIVQSLALLPRYSCSGNCDPSVINRDARIPCRGKQFTVVRYHLSDLVGERYISGTGSYHCRTRRNFCNYNRRAWDYH